MEKLKLVTDGVIIGVDTCMEMDFGNLIPYSYILWDAWKL